MDGAALVFFSSDFSNVNLDGKTVAAVLNGDIKNWNDPAIAALNPDSTLPDLPISLDPKATQAQVTALSEWFTRLSGAPVNLGKLKIDNTIGGQDRLYSLAEGGIAIADASDALAASAATVTIVTGKSLETDVVSLDSTTLASASGQFKIAKTATSLGLTFDAKVSPLTPKGSDTAVTPYQAVFPINMYLCGTDNLKTRAFGRFLLRQDTQGNIAGGSSLPLPDSIRIKAIEVIEKGLPKPTAAPAQ
jgi:phosphate transport system substrate-binding protein